MAFGKRFYVAVPAVTWSPDEGTFRYDPDRLRVVVSSGPAPRIFCLSQDSAIQSALSGVCEAAPEFARVLADVEPMRPAWRGLCLYLAAAAAFKSAANAVPMEVRDWSARSAKRGAEMAVPDGVAELLSLLRLGWNDDPQNMAFVREHYGASVADRYLEIEDGTSGTALTALLGLDVKTDVLDVVLGQGAERTRAVLETLSTDCVIDLGRNGLELTALTQALSGAEFDELRREAAGVYLEMDLADDTWRVGSPTTGFRSEPYPMAAPSQEFAPCRDGDAPQQTEEFVPEEREETPEEAPVLSL